VRTRISIAAFVIVAVMVALVIIGTQRNTGIEQQAAADVPAPTTTTTQDPNIAIWYKAAADQAWYDQIARDTAWYEEAARQEAERQAAAERAAAAAARPRTVSAAPVYSGGTNSSFLECVKQRESGGNYSVVDSTGSWYGAYQFSQSTWNATASRAGRPDLVGVSPSSASPGDQDAMALYLYETQGSSPWAGGSHPC